jgi:lactoylglutathione lyase
VYFCRGEPLFALAQFALSPKLFDIRKEKAMIKDLPTATIYVSDQDRARDFYVNKLGFKTEEAPLPGGMRWVVVWPEGSATAFALMLPRSAEEHAGGATGFVFSSDNLEADYQELTAKGVKFTKPPTNQGWGMLSEFEDADGNRIGLSQVSNMQRD